MKDTQIINSSSLRRFAASMYPMAQAQPGHVITARPVPGNEMILVREGRTYRLTLRRWERDIAAEDLAAVAEAFVLPPNVEPVLDQRHERHPVAMKALPCYYARWAWIE